MYLDLFWRIYICELTQSLNWFNLIYHYNLKSVTEVSWSGFFFFGDFFFNFQRKQLAFLSIHEIVFPTFIVKTVLLHLFVVLAVTRIMV